LDIAFVKTQQQQQQQKPTKPRHAW